jgi:hypothetical protein
MGTTAKVQDWPVACSCSGKWLATSATDVARHCQVALRIFLQWKLNLGSLFYCEM